jgi:UDP-glucuronate 4-epimerase
MNILVTGVAGFIGMNVVKSLLERGEQVVGIDNFSEYGNVNLKKNRLDLLLKYKNFKFHELDICNKEKLRGLFEAYKPRKVLNLAAQTGVRYSIKNPKIYIESNIVGFSNLLEECRDAGVEHLVYASSSSVYGLNVSMPYSESDCTNHPVSLYAASKKSNELMAHSYSHLFGLPTTGLRYFTVYGPYGRPDMSPWLFTDAILKGRPINVFNYGKMLRDYTFVGDVVKATIGILDSNATPSKEFDAHNPDPASSSAPYRIYNVGNHTPIQLMDFIKSLEEALNIQAKINLLPLQPGDVIATCADVKLIKRAIGFTPSTNLEVGVKQWVDWYLQYGLH